MACAFVKSHKTGKQTIVAHGALKQGINALLPEQGALRLRCIFNVLTEEHTVFIEVILVFVQRSIGDVLEFFFLG